jgi:transposase-like protein
VARRSALGTERSHAAIIALEYGATRQAAAGAAGVTATTFYRWLDDVSFRDEVEKAEHRAEYAYTQAVANAVPKNWQAAAWWLERRRYRDYARHDSVEVRIDLKAEIRKLADELGLDEATILADAEALLGVR